MNLELHVWGPAHGLPSFDAACLAAIAYLRECLLPRESWVIVPSNDLNISPFGELPALLDRSGAVSAVNKGQAEGIWVAGYRNIVSYLSHLSGEGKWDLDSDLSSRQNADRIASMSFIESRGQPLLDLSLFVSSDNYNVSTRFVLSDLLRWPASWQVPGRLRDRAKRRSEHLGLSGLDIDAVRDEAEKEVMAKQMTAQIPASLRVPAKKTLSVMLGGRNVGRQRFRLEAVTAEFFDVIERKFNDGDDHDDDDKNAVTKKSEGDEPPQNTRKKWLVDNDRARSVDCLLLGYLAVMAADTNPQLPHPWLKETLETKHSKLNEWTKRNVEEWFGGSSVGMDIRDSSLPWKQPSIRSWIELSSNVLDAFVDALPVLGSIYSPHKVILPSFATSEFLANSHITNTNTTTSKSSSNTSVKHHRQKQKFLVNAREKQLLFRQILISVLCVTGFTGIMAYNGVVWLPAIFPWQQRSRRQPRRFGDAGILLGLG